MDPNTIFNGTDRTKTNNDTRSNLRDPEPVKMLMLDRKLDEIRNRQKFGYCSNKKALHECRAPFYEFAFHPWK